MKSIPKLIRRFAGILLLGILLLLTLNIAAFALISSRQISNASPWQTAQKTADALTEKDGCYTLAPDAAANLKAGHIWAVFIDNKTLSVVWHTDALPNAVPMQYTASGIVRLTRGYIDDCPTFTGEAENGLLVLGYPPKSFWKHLWSSWDYTFIKALPKTLLAIAAANALLLFLLYMAANMTLLKSVNPVIHGIQCIGKGKAVHIPEHGILSELAVNINRASETLAAQDLALRKKETARANWIAGVSHDIRTPLSMVMGYAGQLENERALPAFLREKAAVIRRQSERMKQLINDLNLASKLEYNMQPLNEKEENAVALVRQVVADFINSGMDNKYTIVWDTDDRLAACPVSADKNLLKRAVCNLMQNSINHNEDGCTVYVSVRAEKNCCIICVADDGVGVSEQQLAQLNSAPHYMVCDANTTTQRHGLGLLIVRQIAAAHNGNVRLGHSSYGGFGAMLSLPLSKSVTFS